VSRRPSRSQRDTPKRGAVSPDRRRMAARRPPLTLEGLGLEVLSGLSRGTLRELSRLGVTRLAELHPSQLRFRPGPLSSRAFSDLQRRALAVRHALHQGRLPPAGTAATSFVRGIRSRGIRALPGHLRMDASPHRLGLTNVAGFPVSLQGLRLEAGGRTLVDLPDTVLRPRESFSVVSARLDGRKADRVLPGTRPLYAADAPPRLVLVSGEPWPGEDGPPPDDGGEQEPPSDKRLPKVSIEHVFARDPEIPMPAIPHFIHVPYVEASVPPETRPGEVLPPAHYTVQSVDPANATLVIHLSTQGLFKDPLIHVRSVTAEVKGPAGEKTYPFAAGEYWDTGFNKADVPLEGLGLHRVKIVGQNAIERRGSTYFLVHVSLDPADQAGVNQLRAQLDVLRNPANPVPDPAAVAALEQALRSALADALRRPRLQVRHVDKGPYSAAIENDWKFMVKLYSPGVPSMARLQDQPSQTEQPPKLTYCRPYQPGELLSFAPPADTEKGGKYFTTRPPYVGNITYDTDGLLHGNTMEAMESKVAQEIFYQSTMYGVEIAGPPCEVLRKPTDFVALRAAGLPDPCAGRSGTYRWDVITAPKGATWRFEPPGPSPSRTTRFYTDRSGHYTVRVFFDVDDINCPHVHDTLDLDVEVRGEATVALYRLGNYPAVLAEHVGRPYYHERCLDSKQGAEILFGARFGDLGRVFQATASFPEEIRVHAQLVARAYVKADRSEWVDYGVPPYLEWDASRHTVRIELDSIDPIYGVHLIRIHYDDLMKLEGQAVKVRLAHRAAPLECGGGDARFEDPVPLSATEAGPGVMIAEEGEEDDPALRPPGDREPPVRTLVNLLLFNRDIGNPAVGFAERQLDADGMHHNAANGNAYLPVPVTNTDGLGFSVNLNLHYNSLHSSYGAALRDLMIYNGVSAAEVRAEYDGWLFGPGWTCNLDLRLFDYVVAEGAENATLLERMELVCPDGNRIQFGKTPEGRYEPLYDADVFGGSPDDLLSLWLERVGQEFQLTDKHGNRWSFDRAGRLREQGDPRTTAGSMRPLRIEVSAGRITVTDTPGRRTVLRLADGVVETVRDPAGRETTFAYEWAPVLDDPELPLGLPLLYQITDRLDRIRQFEYDDDFFFMTWKTNRRGFEVTLNYYPDPPPPDVPATVASWFWGRLKSFTDGDRGLTVKYLERWPGTPAGPAGTPFTPQRVGQPVEILDTADCSVYAKLDLPRLAILETWGKRKQDGVLRQLAGYAYRGSSKALDRCTDIWGQTSAWQYRPATGRPRSRNLFEAKDAEQQAFQYTWNSDNRVEAVKHPNGATYSLKYDAWGNLEKLTQPETRVAVGLTQESNQALSTSWRFDDRGYLREMTDPAGYTTTYRYGGAGDPGRSRRPTSMLRDVQAGDQASRVRHTYNRNGQLMDARHADSGLTLTFRRDRMGRPWREVRRGPRMQTYVQTIERNEHDQVTSLADTVGRLDIMTYNRFDEEDSRNLAGGFSHVILERDEHGNPLRVREFTGRVKTYEWDELDRLIRNTFPPPEGGNEQHAPMSWVHDDQNRRTVETQGTRTTTFVYDRVRRLTEIQYDEGDGLSRKTIHRYGSGDARPRSTERTATGAPPHRTTYTRDRTGQLTGIEQRTSTGRYRTTFVYDANGHVARVRPPRFPANPIGTPGVAHEYDGLGRRIRTADSYGRVVEETVFPSPSRILVRRPAPDQEETGTAAGTLVTAREMQVDAMGRVVVERTFGQDARYQYDAAGRMTAFIASGGQFLQIEYTPLGAPRVIRRRQSETREVNGIFFPVESVAVTTFQYDGLGNVLSRIRPGESSTYRYDELGRRIGETRNGQVWLAVAYDSLGRIKEVTDARGGVQTVAYDEAAQEVKTRYRRGLHQEERTHRLDASGWLAHFESTASPISLTYQHTPLGRLRGVRYETAQGNLGSVEFLYDSGGNRRSRTVKFGTSTYRTSYGHDANARLSTMVAPHAGSMRFQYNPAGLIRYIRRGAGTGFETEFRNDADANFEGVFHRSPGPPRVSSSHQLLDRPADDRPRERRLSVTIMGSPSDAHRRRARLTYTPDGKVWTQTVTQQVVAAEGYRTEVTTRSAIHADGRPATLVTTTRVLDHRELAGKQAVTRVDYRYHPDRRLRSFRRVSRDLDGRLVDDTSVSCFHDGAGNLMRRDSEHRNGEGKRLWERCVFQYDGGFRLARVDFLLEKDTEGVKHLKTHHYFYGPGGELLGERREYHEVAFSTFVAADPLLEDRPNPLYHLHDQQQVTAQVSSDSKLYLFTDHAPGANYPLVAVDRTNQGFFVHQDESGTTAYFTDRTGKLLRYGPLTAGTIEQPVERAAAVGGAHRLGDGALENVWPAFLDQAMPPVRYLGEGLPFSLIPAEPADLASFADHEATLYGQHVLGQRTAWEQLLAALKYLQYLVPARLITEGLIDTFKRRYAEFQENGVTRPAAQALNAAIGDFLGYTDLLEAIVGVDTTNSTSLSTSRRWFKGIWGAVSLLTLGAGSALKALKFAAAAKPSGTAARFLFAVETQLPAWETAIQVGNHLDTGFGVLALADGLLAHPDNPVLRNSSSLGRMVKRLHAVTLTPTGDLLANKVPVEKPNKLYLPFVDIVLGGYHRAYGVLREAGQLPLGDKFAGEQGTLADALVKAWIKGRVGSVSAAERGAFRRGLQDLLGTTRLSEVIETDFPLSSLTKHDLDVLAKLVMGVEFKRTVGIGTQIPGGKAGQFGAASTYAKNNGAYICYVGARERTTVPGQYMNHIPAIL
jgi:YD repeat-containing protein